MCLDFNSAQGTFVNKKALEASIYQRLYVGDIVKFGVSTRQYVVKGPEAHVLPEYDSENLRKFRDSIQQKSVVDKKKKEEKESVLWGFGPDDEDEYNTNQGSAENDEDEPEYLRKDPNYARKFGTEFISTVKDSDVDEKDTAILQKLRLKEQKIRNMLEENRRIYMKEASQDAGLTDGQNAAVTRNDSRIEQLKDEIQELMNTLQSKKQSRGGVTTASSNAKNGHKKQAANMDSDDDMWDSTKDTQDVGTNWRLRRKLKQQAGKVMGEAGSALQTALEKSKGEGMTFEELKGLTESLQEKSVSLERQISEHASTVDRWSSRDARSADDDDAVEALVLETSAKQATAAIDSLRGQLYRNNSELSTAMKLLAAATPALRSQSGSKYQASAAGASGTANTAQDTAHNTSLDNIVGNPIELKAISSAAVAAASISASLVAAANSNPATSLTTSLVGVNDVRQSKQRLVDDTSSAMQVKAVADSDIVVEAAAVPSIPIPAAVVSVHTASSSSSSSCLIQPTPRQVGPQRPPTSSSNMSMTETMKRLTQTNADDSCSSHELTSNRSRAENGPAIKKARSGGANTLQDGEVAWVAPRNQTGNGKTWLNEKLGY